MRAIDEENKVIALKNTEGELMELYKIFDVTIQCIPKGEGSMYAWNWL